MSSSTLKPPSRLEIIGTPAFSLSWYGDPGDGTSVVAYSGGGGSARTGVTNVLAVTINDAPEPVRIDTGTKLGAFVHIYANPVTQQRWILVALSLGKLSMGSEIHRYRLPDCQLDGILKVQASCNFVAVNALTDRMALGCEDGSVQLHALSDEGPFGQGPEVTPEPLLQCSQHTEAVCTVAFSARGDRLVSSAKDGTACVWRASDGTLLDQLTCDVTDPTAKPPPPRKTTAARANNTKKRGPPQVLVRGCAFGDMEGTLVYTVASARRGKAFLSRWLLDPKTNQQQQQPKYKLQDRLAVSDCPVSAMGLSQDGGLLVLGSVDGNVNLWGTADWRPLRIFKEVHGLPLTCVAPRPYPVRLHGEEDGVEIHARTGSADGTLGCLTLQTRLPNAGWTPGAEASGWMVTLHRCLMLLVVLYALSPVLQEMGTKCSQALYSGHRPLKVWVSCVWEEVIIAPDWRPGVVTPPY